MPQRKISRGSPEFVNIIERVANLSNIKNIDYDIQFGCDEVDCYVGGLYKVRLNGYRDGQKIKMNYIIKWHNDAKRRKALRESYKREYYFYEIIVPNLLEVERTHNLIEGLKIKFPNCIFASIEHDKEFIVLSNPQFEGFKFHDRLHKLDLDHASLVMKNLAKLHGLSFVLEKFHPQKFEEIKKIYCTDVQYSNPNEISSTMATFFNASVNVVRDDVARKKLQNCVSDIPLILSKCAMPNLSKYLTVCHGDCWNNNVIYRYQNTKPIDVMLVDYQLTRYASPVTDIAYFLYMSADPQFLSEHYERMITLYYRTLSAVLRQCDLDPKEIYPNHVFRKHLEEYSVFGLIEALVSMKIITAEPEEAVKMTEVKYDCCEDECLKKDVQYCSLFVDRVNGVVDEFFSRNYTLDAVLSNS